MLIYQGLENGWNGYKQLAGSQYASTKRAEEEVLSRHSYDVQDKQAAADGEL